MTVHEGKCVYYTLTVPVEQVEEIERLFDELVEIMRDEEPGATVYTIHRMPEQVGSYAIYEDFRTDADADIHAQGPRMCEWKARYNAVITGDERHMLEPIAAVRDRRA